MRPLRPFTSYLDEGVIKRVTPDPERAASLRKESRRKLKTLTTNLRLVGITAENANDYAEYCYDLLMLSVRALLYEHGYVARGAGAHEAEVAALTNFGIADDDIRFLNQLRYFRNGMLYYGTTIDEQYARQVITFTKRLAQALKEVKT